MASGITIIKQPNTHHPAFNDQWFTATSSNIAQPNFQFYVTITVHYYDGSSYTTKVSNIPIDNPPDSVMRFNAKSFVKKHVRNHIPLNTAGWQSCTNGMVKVVVNVGERYGTIPAVTTGSNITYYAWNASLGFIEMATVLNSTTYLASTYVANNGATFPILNDYPDVRTSAYSQNFIYILCNSDNVVSKATVTSNDGVSIASFDITNTLLNSGNWYDGYLCLNVAPYLLAVLGGVNWIAVEGTDYLVKLYDNTNTLRKTITFTYSEVCTKFFTYQQIYLNKKGAYDTMFFEKVSERENTIERSKVTHTPYYDPTASGAMAYQASQPTEFINSVKTKKTIKIRTDWITDDQCSTLIDHATSPSVYLQEAEGSAVVIYSCTLTDGKYKENKKYNSKLWALETNVDLSYTDNRQSGVQ